MKTITDYVIQGLMSEDLDVFKKRISLIVERTNMLEPLVKGVPTKISSVDTDKVLEFFRNRETQNATSIVSIEITDDFQIKIRCECYRVAFADTDKHAEEAATGGYTGLIYSKDAEHLIECKQKYCDYTYTTIETAVENGISIEYV